MKVINFLIMACALLAAGCAGQQNQEVLNSSVDLKQPETKAEAGGSDLGIVTKKYGGKYVIMIPEGKRLVPYTVQWEPKSANLWYLTEDAPKDYSPKVYEFKERSNWGAMQGTVVFVEQKQ